MTLITFYKTLQDLLEVQGGSILQNTSTVASNTRFHFSTFFQCLQYSFKQGPQNCAKAEIFHLALLKD